MHAVERFEIKAGGKYRHYQIEALLGRGGMGAVYRARHEITGRIAAIKVLRRRPGMPKVNDVALERFKREAAVMCAFEHPCLPQIYEMDLVDGTPVMVMEYLEGEDLSRVLHARGRLTVTETLWIGLEIVKPLVLLHAQSVVHRDLKPANIFICNEGKHRVRVLDFGISLQKEQKGLTSGELLVGTICYIAPEYLSGEPVDGRSDQYSVGCILYELLDGHPLFLGGAGEKPPAPVLCHWHCTRPVPDLRRARPDLPDPVWRIVERLLSKKPEERFPTTEALADALREAQQAEIAKKRAAVSARGATSEEPPSGPDTEVGEPPDSSSGRVVPVVPGVRGLVPAAPGAARAGVEPVGPVARVAEVAEVATAQAAGLSATLESPRHEPLARGEDPTRRVALAAVRDGDDGEVSSLAGLLATTPMSRDELGVAPTAAPSVATDPDDLPAYEVNDAQSLARWLSQFANAYLRAAGALHIESARLALEDALDAPDPRLRTAAASELALIGDARSVPRLRDAQVREHVPMVLFTLEHTLSLLAVAPVRGDGAETSPLPRASVTARATSNEPSAAASTDVPRPKARTREPPERVTEAPLGLYFEGTEVPLGAGHTVSLGLRKGDVMLPLVTLDPRADGVRVTDAYEHASAAYQRFKTTKRDQEPNGMLYPGGVLAVMNPNGAPYRLRLFRRSKRAPTQVPRFLWLNEVRAKRPSGLRSGLVDAVGALRFRHPEMLFTVFVWLGFLAIAFLLAALVRTAIVGARQVPAGSRFAAHEAEAPGGRVLEPGHRMTKVEQPPVADGTNRVRAMRAWTTRGASVRAGGERPPGLRVREGEA